MSWVEKTGLLMFLVLFTKSEILSNGEIITFLVMGIICFFFGQYIAKWISLEK